MKATLSYLADLPIYHHEKPYELWLPPDDLPENGFATTNCKFEEHSDIDILDARTSKTAFTFETTGFKFVSDPLELEDTHLLVKREERLRGYLERTIDLVKLEFEATKVICFDWRYRKTQPLQRKEFQDYESKREQPLRPAHIAHQDDSVMGGRERLRRHLTESEISDFENGLRARFVNIWRPLVPVVKDMPLALCDRRTVGQGDLVECDKIHPDHVGEGLYLKYRPSHRWYWLPEQTRDEPVIFITWDSWGSEFPVGPPHVAFRDPSSMDALPRESIEVRLIVLSGDT